MEIIRQSGIGLIKDTWLCLEKNFFYVGVGGLAVAASQSLLLHLP